MIAHILSGLDLYDKVSFITSEQGGARTTARPPATDADTREYHAMRGRKANRAAYLLIIPNQDHDDRFSRFTRLSLIDASKDGRQIILEFSGCSVLLEG